MGKIGKIQRRKKAAALLVSSALAAAPFLLQTPYVSAVVETPPPDVPVEEYAPADILGDRFVSLDINKPPSVIDLSMAYGNYGAYDFHVYVDHPEIATYDPGYAGNRLLKIYPKTAGTATFTIEFLTFNYENYEFIHHEDTFQVTVDSTSSVERILNISDIVKKMMNVPSEYATADAVKSILGDIKPEFLPWQAAGNHAPVLVADAEVSPVRDYTVSAGQDIHLGDLTQFFSDPDPLDFVDISAVPVGLDMDYDEYLNEHLIASLEDRGEGSPYWVLSGYTPGTQTFRFVATDHHGGVYESDPFTVTVTGNMPPQLNLNNVFANHFQHNSEDLEDSANHMMYLSQNAEINLDDVFTDPEEDWVSYEVDVLSSSSPIPNQVMLPTSILSWEQLDAGYMSRIVQIRAIDSHENSTELNVDIEKSSTDPFPSAIPIYQSIDTQDPELTSSYVVNYDVAFGDNVVVESGDLQPVGETTVTASVYNNDYLKFDAPNFEDVNANKFNVYAHLQETSSILYLADIKFNVVPLTPNLINLETLYPDWLTIFYANDNFIIDYVSVIDEVYNDSAISATSYYLMFNGQVPNGTTIQVAIDPYEGTSVYYVPFRRQ